MSKLLSMPLVAILAIFLDIFALAQGSLIEHKVIANFDTVPIAASGLGHYDSLIWQGISVATSPNYLLDPHSPQNVAIVGPAQAQVVCPARISSKYVNSTIIQFALKSFYYGCVIPCPLSETTGVSSTSCTTPCNITVKGYDSLENLVAQHTVVYDVVKDITKCSTTNPKHLAMPQIVMNKDFQGLTDVTFQPESPLGEADQLTMVFDDIYYVTDTVIGTVPTY
ncbi:hypothetical protein AOQ84DRAFT_419175 [Glonium stellatum]|uniref:Uncharacterized protein n=1 Tax=Glonium stellatum TaxID=574774 RepID=A0A8E2JNA5_9PEZI|nr:hypothetical protein AOQ84DRAFT_419175 [Glonium stellatum]